MPTQPNSNLSRPLGRVAAARQRGITTVLLLLLIGLALGASVIGGIAYVRNTQEQGMTAHAQTQAQMKAWAAAELVRQYFQALKDDGKLTNFLAQTVPITLSFSGTGATNLMAAKVTAVDTTNNTATVEVTGLTATGSRAEASAKLSVFYKLGSSGSSTQQCYSNPKASAVFKGDMSITGGTTSITSNSSYQDIAVDGNLTISNASTAIISGCAKGNISLSGGGIDANATLSSEGSITINSMATPTNATLWAKSINIGNSGNGTYAAVKAGAYAVNVLDASNVVVGTANVGGTLLTGTTPASIPWTTGTVVPPSTGNLLITLSGGGTYLLDLSKVTVTASTGVVSNTSVGATLLSGTGTLPGSLKFVATSIYGGGVDLYVLTIGTLWGHAVNIQGWSGTYTKIFSNGDMKIVTGTIGNVQGGGYMWATQAGAGTGYSYSFPTVTSGSIAGSLYYGGGKTLASGSISGVTLSRNVTGTSPGLPGIPYCDTRTDTVNADAQKAAANYVFEFVSNVPRLTVQNVKRTSNGVSIDGVYPLVSPTTAQRAILNELMTCGWSEQNNAGCLQSSGANATWSLSGVLKYPKGISWFDRALTVDGTQVDLVTSIVSKSNVTLTSSGHQALKAPNFSTPAIVCDGTFYPTNLCNKTGTSSTFVTWTDSDGTTQTGLPLANMALLIEGALSTSGWTIYGNVKLGGAASTNGASSTVYGAVTVGSNTTSTTTITAGGFVVDTTTVSSSQSKSPGTTCVTQTSSGGGSSVTMSGARAL